MRGSWSWHSVPRSHYWRGAEEKCSVVTFGVSHILNACAEWTAFKIICPDAKSSQGNFQDCLCLTLQWKDEIFSSRLCILSCNVCLSGKFNWSILSWRRRICNAYRTFPKLEKGSSAQILLYKNFMLSHSKTVRRTPNVVRLLAWVFWRPAHGYVCG